MVLTFLRALFILLMAAVGWYFLRDPAQPFHEYTWLMLAAAITVSTLLICIDILSPRQKLAIFSGIVVGLVVGVAVTYVLSFVVQMLADQLMKMPDKLSPMDTASWKAVHDGTISFIDLMLGISCCYLAISFILQTKDDFRFVIPYVEFSKQIKGARPILLDTSVLIDGRVLDMVQTGILESQLIVPRFVLDELHTISDSGDKLSRTKGRHGLDVLNKLQKDPNVDVMLYEVSDRDGLLEVDERLIQLAKTLNGRVLTNDFNLNKVAQLRGVSVINLNALANAMKPVVKVGERIKVTILKPGDLPGQGVGYLEDGTMVVVEQARSHINEELELTVTNTRQTAAGRMIFGKSTPTGSDVPLLG
jgi:uncharacterized protein YacL